MRGLWFSQDNPTRLFLPPGTDDASHDEALSSRIAAVNLLDLGLGHLGVEVGKAGREVEALVKGCGQSTSAFIVTSGILITNAHVY